MLKICTPPKVNNVGPMKKADMETVNGNLRETNGSLFHLACGFNRMARVFANRRIFARVFCFAKRILPFAMRFYRPRFQRWLQNDRLGAGVCFEVRRRICPHSIYRQESRRIFEYGICTLVGTGVLDGP